MVDVLVDFLRGHSNARITDGQGAIVCIQHHFHSGRGGDGANLTHLGEHGPLLSGIDSIGNEFTQENFLIAVQELLDDGEDVVCGDVDGALLCHGGEVVVGLVSVE